MIIRAIVLLGALSLLGLTNDEVARNVYNYLHGDPKGSELQVVTPEIREQVVLRLRRYAYGFDSETGAKTDNSRDSSALVVLLRLGDLQTIKEMMNEYHQSPGEWDRGYRAEGLVDLNDRDFAESAQPLLIPYLAREFFRDDLHLAPDENEKTDLVPASVGSGYYAVSIMKNSPVFSANVRKWADKAYFALRLHTGRDIVKYQQVMQQWWRDDAKHFETKDYAAVKPGVPLVSAFVEPKPLVAVEASQQPMASAELPLATAPAAQPAPAPSTSSPLIYPLAIGFTALLLGALAFFLRRKT